MRVRVRVRFDKVNSSGKKRREERKKKREKLRKIVAASVVVHTKSCVARENAYILTIPGDLPGGGGGMGI